MSLSIIAALDNNSLIGNNGTLPWHIPEDLAWFKAQTLGKTVVMGRKTWLSLGKPLPGRRNIVLSKSIDFKPEGAEVFDSIHAVLDLSQQEEVFIIGGREVFSQFLPYATKLYLSRIAAVFGGDTYFPDYPKADWVLISQQDILSQAGFKLSFLIYNTLSSLPPAPGDALVNPS